MNTTYHKSVLVNEVLQYLDPKPNKLYVDVTFGGGGHTRAILQKEPTCRVIAIDWDQNALEKNGETLVQEFGDRLTLVWGNFANLHKLLKKINIQSIDGILADFGTSQFQITQLPGFSFSKDSVLDMRMSPSHQLETAQDIVNFYKEKELADIFYEFAEERRSRAIAKAIVQERQKKRITTTLQLADIVQRVVGWDNRKKIHPATKVFQALRIYVNQELSNIKSFLSASLDLLSEEGRIVCISFHSLEDRIVKQYFKEHECNSDKGFKILTRKVVQGTDEEIRANPSSRSAKLRAAEICMDKKIK